MAIFDPTVRAPSRAEVGFLCRHLDRSLSYLEAARFQAEQAGFDGARMRRLYAAEKELREVVASFAEVV